MPDTDETISSNPEHETSILWEEAGFIPPVFCRDIIEFLHRLNSDHIENVNEADLISGLIRHDEKTVSGCSEYIFTDRERMYCFAGEMGIPDGNMSDTEIAEEILFRLIKEYTGDNLPFPKKQDHWDYFRRFPSALHKTLKILG